MLLGLLLAMLLGALDQTIIAPALPSIAGELGGLDQIPAVVTSYLIAATVMMPVYGKLGDRFGRKPVMLLAIGVFVLGGVLCGLARSMPQLVVFRALQGIGGGGLIIGAQAVIGEVVSPRERGRYLGYIGAAYTFAAVGGPVIGGFLIDELSWRWIFALYPPLGAIAFALIAFKLRLPKPSRRAPIDFTGAAGLATATIGLVLAGQTRRLAFAVVTIVGAAVWLWAARRATDPIIPPRLLRDRAFAIPVAISFLIGFTLFGIIAYVPAFLQVSEGFTATRAGLYITVLMGGMLVTTIGSGRLITRTGRYKGYPVVGTAIATAALGLLAAFGARGGPPVIAALMFLLGLGVGLVQQVMVLAMQNAAAYEDLGTATSSVTFFRQIGASMGVAVSGAVLTWRLADGTAEAAFSDAVTLMFVFTTPLLGIAFALALMIPALPLRTTSHVEERQ